MQTKVRHAIKSSRGNEKYLNTIINDTWSNKNGCVSCYKGYVTIIVEMFWSINDACAQDDRVVVVFLLLKVLLIRADWRFISGVMPHAYFPEKTREEARLVLTTKYKKKWYNTHSNKLCNHWQATKCWAQRLVKTKAFFHRKWEITKMRINGLHGVHTYMVAEQSRSLTTNKIRGRFCCDENKFSPHLFCLMWKWSHKTNHYRYLHINLNSIDISKTQTVMHT